MKGRSEQLEPQVERSGKAGSHAVMIVSPKYTLMYSAKAAEKSDGHAFRTADIVASKRHYPSAVHK